MLLSAQATQPTIKINGKVINQKTLEPIPYAHIVINNTSVGTITNEFGDFKLALPNKYANGTLKISSIGFESAFIRLSSTKNLNELTIKLKKSTKFLESVVITPVDEARQLVKQAIERITDNYPLEPRSSEGFFRSVVKLNNNPYYITEASLSINKKSYATKHARGDVSVNKGRFIRNDSLINKFQTLLMAGPHIPHRFDFVMNRAGPLGNTKKFEFSILDTVSFENDRLVKVHFSAIKKNIEGNLFISLKNKAFVKGEYFYKIPDFEGDMLKNLNSRKRTYLNYKANYKIGNNGWELFLVNYNTSFAYNGDTLTVKDTYVTTRILDEYRKISYDSNLQFSDFFLHNTGKYDSAFWNNYNIVLPSKETEMLFAKYNLEATLTGNANQEKAVNKMLRLLEIMSKFKFTMGVFAQPATIDNVLINYTNGTSIITETVPSTTFFYYGLSFTYEYYFSPSFFIGLDTKGTLTGNTYSSISFKTGYNKEFTAFGRPATANFSVNVGNYRYGYVVGRYNVANELEINNKKFDSGEVQMSFESRRWAVEPTVRLSLEMNHRLSLFAEGGWNMPFSTTDGLYFKERGQPFWKTKQTFVGIPHQEISISDGINELTEIPLQTNLMLNIGVLIHFKY